MLRLRHLAHPVRSAKILYRRMQAGASDQLNHWIMDRHYRKVSRTVREKCWCGGRLLPFEWHASYAVCAECGCYVNRRPPSPEALKEVYTLKRYWQVRQKMKGYPQIDERAELYRSDGRLNYWLSLVDRFAPPSGKVVEIGCSRVFFCPRCKVGGTVARALNPMRRLLLGSVARRA